MREEIKVVEIKPIPEEKIQGSSARKMFYVPITYVLADGREIRTTYRADRKKDVLMYLTKLPMVPRDMSVTLSEDGKINSTIQSLSGIMGW